MSVILAVSVRVDGTAFLVTQRAIAGQERMRPWDGGTERLESHLYALLGIAQVLTLGAVHQRLGRGLRRFGLGFGFGHRRHDWLRHRRWLDGLWWLDGRAVFQRLQRRLGHSRVFRHRGSVYALPRAAFVRYCS